MGKGVEMNDVLGNIYTVYPSDCAVAKVWTAKAQKAEKEFLQKQLEKGSELNEREMRMMSSNAVYTSANGKGKAKQSLGASVNILSRNERRISFDYYMKMREGVVWFCRLWALFITQCQDKEAEYTPEGGDKKWWKVRYRKPHIVVESDGYMGRVETESADEREVGIWQSDEDTAGHITKPRQLSEQEAEDVLWYMYVNMRCNESHKYKVVTSRGDGSGEKYRVQGKGSEWREWEVRAGKEVGCWRQFIL